MSIAAVDLTDGKTFRYGATGGMRTGSIVKLFILQTLLLQHQDAGTSLNSTQKRLAVRMIEHSDNSAASALYDDIGGNHGLNHAAERLRVEHTVPGPPGYFGLTQTCASDFIALLRNLVSRRALDAASRSYVLNLMKNVEPDQHWGVSAAADPGTVTPLKNGWLDTQADGGRWLVNSVGIVTDHKHRVLLAVLTQHGHSFGGGIKLVEKLAKIAGAAVVS